MKNSKKIHLVFAMEFYLIEKIKPSVKRRKKKAGASKYMKKYTDNGEQSVEAKANQEVKA